MAEELSRLRADLKAADIRIRNAKSQLARMRTPDPAREGELRERIATGESQAEELRKAVARGERLRLDDGTVRQRPGNFDEVWKTMTIEQQGVRLCQLVERVGYDARGDKVKVTYNSAGIKEFCQKGATQ